MRLLTGLLLCLCTQVFANNPDHINTGNSKAVFIDFETANYFIQFDIKKKKAFVKTEIYFNQDTAGNPIFDLVEDVLDLRVNGKKVKVKEINSPDRVTKYKLAQITLGPGAHRFEIKSEIKENLSFEKGGVLAGFWMSDLSDRTYIEQYIPTNIEYDQYQMNFNIEFIGAKKKQKIYTNGLLKKLSENSFSIKYPTYFTASSLYFHTATEGRFKEVKANYKSINGKNIPILIYSKNSWNLNTAKERTLKTLAELENKWGAWAHSSFIAYIAGQGGMEHSGATITSMRALEHEITHSYFARGVLPIDGNSGWMDEAIASWRDGGYKTAKKPNFNSASMASHSQYKRTTDRRAYTQGANFMAYLNHTLTNIGGLEKFLELMYTKYIHKSIHTETFRKELESFSGLNFEADFKQYIYGEKTKSNEAQLENPFHPKLSKNDLLNLL